MEAELSQIPALRVNLRNLMPAFSKGFRENSQRTRIILFTNEVAQFLWSHYVVADEAYLVSYIARLAAKRHDFYHARALLQSMKAVSNGSNFSLLSAAQMGAVRNRYATE